MKKVLKKFLICILIVAIASNFTLALMGANTVFADEEFSMGATMSNLLTGLIGLLTWLYTLPIAGLIIAISNILGGLARLGVGATSYGEVLSDAIMITPFHVLFNKIPLVDINFFDFSATGIILQFREAVAGWYYTMRLLASMILLVILIYIGIRMATTSIATEKAIYKKMLVDWASSLALLFLLHYIMIFVFTVNNALVNAMAKVAEASSGIETMMTQVEMQMFSIDIVIRIAAVIIFGMLVFQTISFLVAYIKRMFTIGFLIIIAPLITITYSMDKIGDGKAQALNTWLKEFIYNILIQPFQCILYLVFAKFALDTMLASNFQVFQRNNVGSAIFAILSLQFIKEGEKIIKKIFGFDKASTAGDLAMGAALTGAALLKGKDVASKAGGALSKGKNMISNSKALNTLKSGLEKNGLKIKEGLSEKRKDGTKLGKAIDKTANALEKGKTTVGKAAEKAAKTAQVFIPSESLRKKAQEREQKIEQLAQKKFEEAGNKGNVTDSKDKEKFLAEARNQLKSEKKKPDGKVISGIKGIGSTFGKASVEALGGFKNFVADHPKEIMGIGMGLFGAGMGMAAGDFGDISKAIAGYGMGSGFMQGWYKNSAKELQSQTDSAAQLYANMTGNGNAEDQLARAYMLGMTGELGKMIKESMKDLESSMRNKDGGALALDRFVKEALGKNAGGITEEGIRDLLRQHGVTNDDGSVSEDLVSKFRDYGTLLASQTLFSNIQSAEAMGIDREQLARMMGDRETIRTTTVNSERIIENHTSETITEEVPVNASDNIEAIVSAIQRNLNSSGNVEVKGLDETNQKIDELNRLINTLNSQNADVKSQILSAVKTNNSNIESHDQIVRQLESQLQRYEKQRTAND